MRIILLLPTLLFMANVHADISLPTSIRGKCYVAEFDHPSTNDKNILTICVKNNEATARMIYSNSGDLPTVCYHKGVYSRANENEFQIKLEEGMCDNNREFSSDSISCASFIKNTYTCKSPKGTMQLKLLRRPNERT